MVTLMIENSNLPTGYNVENVSWWLGTDDKFTEASTVASSIEDTVHLTNIQFDLTLEIGVQYYAKCRIVYNKGFSNDSNIHIFVAKDLNEIALDLAIPSKISRPTISISPAGALKPTGLLTFSGGEFNTKYNVAQESATYILEDMNGDVKWSRINDSVNLNSVKLSIALDENSAYRLFVSYRGKNNNESQFAMETFVTGSNNIKMDGDLNSIPAGMNLDFEVNLVGSNISAVSYNLYADQGFLVDSKTILSTDGIPMNKWSVDGSLIERDIDYVLSVSSVDALGKTEQGYFYFKPYFDLSITPDTNFKYTNTVENFSPSYTAAMFNTATGYRPELPNGEIIQSSIDGDNIYFNFYKFDQSSKKFNYTGRTASFGNIFGSLSGYQMDDFSYKLLKNGKLVIKCNRDGMTISAPYNVVSGELNMNLVRIKKLDTSGTESYTRNQHMIIDASDSKFITFSTASGRLLLVDSNDLSFGFLNAKLYNTNPTQVGIYKLSSELMMIISIAADNVTATYDVYNYKTDTYLYEDVVLDNTDIELTTLVSGLRYGNTKIIPLYNGNILCIFNSTVAGSQVYKTYNVNTNAFNSLMTKTNGIKLGVYSLLKNGKVLQLSDVSGILYS